MPRKILTRPLQRCLVGFRLPMLLLLLTLWPAGQPAAAGSTAASIPARSGQRIGPGNIRIAGPGAGSHAARFEGLARDLIRLRPGDPFSEPALKAALDRLGECGVFERIHADSGPGSGPTVPLTFELAPYRLVRIVDIEGAFPLFKDDIMNAMGLRSGNAFNDQLLEEGKKRLAKLLADEGLLDPRVFVNVRTEPARGSVALAVVIERRGYYRLTQVILSGNRHFTAGAIRSRMKCWRTALWPGITGRFRSRELRKDIRDLVSRYRSRGYASVRIEKKVEKDPQSGHVTVRLEIREGPRYEIVFEGNRHFSDRELRKEVVLFEKGYRHGFGLRRSIRAIREKYRRAGYAHVRVTPVVQDENLNGNPLRRIRLLVEEGPVERVAAVRFIGNGAVDDQTLKGQMLSAPRDAADKPPFSPTVLAEDIAAIRALYHAKGFAHVKVRSEVRRDAARNMVKVLVYIHEGRAMHVRAVGINGLPVDLPPEVRGRLQMQPGTPLRMDLVENDRSLIQSAVAGYGYPYARVTDEIVPAGQAGSVRVVYHVAAGTHTRLRRIFIQGNFQTRPGVILRALTLRPGDVFSLKQMLVSQSGLRDLEIFREVRMRPVGLRQKDRDIVLVVGVGERKPYSVELGAGYDTRRGAFGLLTLGDRNLWGLGLISRLHLFASQIGYSGNLTIRKPNVYGSRFSADGRIFGERMEEFNKPFGTESLGASIGVLRNDWHDFTVGLKGGYQRRRQYQVDQEPINQGDLDPRNVVDATGFLQYDSRDSILLPKNGIFSMGSIYVSQGLDSDADDFIKYRLDTRYYWTPLKRLTFAMAARAGYIDMYGAASSPLDDQLLYLGGAADVRGFRENLLRRDGDGNAVGGRSMLSGTMEARVDVGYGFELITFLDTGMIGHAANPDSRGGFRFTTGLGLNYITPIGPIGLTYGYKLDRREGEDTGRFHFSIGYTF